MPYNVNVLDCLVHMSHVYEKKSVTKCWITQYKHNLLSFKTGGRIKKTHVLIHKFEKCEHFLKWKCLEDKLTRLHNFHWEQCRCCYDILNSPVLLNCNILCIWLGAHSVPANYKKPKNITQIIYLKLMKLKREIALLLITFNRICVNCFLLFVLTNIAIAYVSYLTFSLSLHQSITLLYSLYWGHNSGISFDCRA